MCNPYQLLRCFDCKKDSLPVLKYSASTFYLNVCQNWKNHFKILILVKDCDLLTCATGTCGGEDNSCTRTCINGGVFGDADCPAEEETKTGTCPLLPCGEFEIHKKQSYG